MSRVYDLESHKKANNIIKYLEQYNIINKRQFGFRSRPSTGVLLPYVPEICSINIKYGESGIVTLDVSKTLDQIWHEGRLNEYIVT